MTGVTNQGIAASERTEALAADVERIIGDLLTLLRGCDDARYRRVTAAEQWPVGVVAHHIADVAAFFTGILAGVASGTGEVKALIGEEIEQNNARHAAEYAGVGRLEVIELLEQRGPALVEQIRRLNDAQLDVVASTIDGHPLTVGQVIGVGAIGHFTEHVASIRATVDAGA